MQRIDVARTNSGTDLSRQGSLVEALSIDQVRSQSSVAITQTNHTYTYNANMTTQSTLTSQSREWMTL